jgi:hypothetical protein
MLDKRALLELFESHPQFLLGIHHDRTMPGNRFLRLFRAEIVEQKKRVVGLQPAEANRPIKMDAKGRWPLIYLTIILYRL